MKKNKKTMLTAAVLSAAVAASCESFVTQTEGIAQNVYGPPAVQKGDVNGDFKVDIADYVLLKSYAEDGSVTAPGTADINDDGIVDETDSEMFRRFMFGETSYITDTFLDEPGFQTKYGPPLITPVTEITVETCVPLYGPPSVFDQEVE